MEAVQPCRAAPLAVRAEEAGRLNGRREQRICPHCSGGIETVHHISFECPLYASFREDFACLLAEFQSVRALLECAAACPYTAVCQWQKASGLDQD